MSCFGMGDLDRRSQLHTDIEDYLQHRHRKNPPAHPQGDKSFKNMETYEHSAPKPSLVSRVKSWFSRSKEESRELPPLEQEEPLFKEGEPEPMSEEKRGFLKRLLTFFVKQEEILDEVQEMQPEKVEEAKVDLRELAKLFLKTLERLPEGELKEFKSAPEFEQFKSILRKHQVIK